MNKNITINIDPRTLGFLLLGIGFVLLIGWKPWFLFLLIPFALHFSGWCPLSWKHEEETPRKRKEKSAPEVEENIRGL